MGEAVPRCQHPGHRRRTSEGTPASAFHLHLRGLTLQEFADAGLQTDFESLYVDAETGQVLRTEWLQEGECESAAQAIVHLLVEVTRIIEQEDFEGWIKNRLLGED